MKILHKLGEGREGKAETFQGAPKRAAEIMLVNIIKSDSKNKCVENSIPLTSK